MGEREINHIATGMSPEPRGRLLPLHHGDGGDGDHPDSAPPEFSPSKLQRQVYVSVFLCFDSALLWKMSGDYFYNRF